MLGAVEALVATQGALKTAAWNSWRCHRACAKDPEQALYALCVSQTSPMVGGDENEGAIERQRRPPDFGRSRLELIERVTYDLLRELFSLREKRGEEGRSKL